MVFQKTYIIAYHDKHALTHFVILTPPTCRLNLHQLCEKYRAGAEQITHVRQKPAGIDVGGDGADCFVGRLSHLLLQKKKRDA